MGIGSQIQPSIQASQTSQTPQPMGGKGVQNAVQPSAPTSTPQPMGGKGAGMTGLGQVSTALNPMGLPARPIEGNYSMNGLPPGFSQLPDMVPPGMTMSRLQPGGMPPGMMPPQMPQPVDVVFPGRPSDIGQFGPNTNSPVPSYVNDRFRGGRPFSGYGTPGGLQNLLQSIRNRRMG